MRASVRRLLWPAIAAAAFAAGLMLGDRRSGGEPAVSPALPVEKPGSASFVDHRASRGRLIEVLSVLDPADRSSRLRSLAKDIFSNDPATAWAMRQDIAGVADQEVFCLEVLRAWSSQSPFAALEAAAALPSGRLRTASVAAALEGLARGDAGAALTYAAEHLTGSARENALTAVVHAWAGQDAAAAARWALQNLSAPGNSGTLRAAVQSWADSDPAAASQWVAGLPPGSLSAMAAAALVESWAEQTPAEAAAWIRDQGVKDSLDGASAALAAQWAASDPRAAADWAVTLPRTMTARDAASRAIGEWAAVAPLDAAQWIAAKSPDIKEISPALHQSLAAGWAAQDPAAATAWVQSLSDAWTQKDSAPAVFNTWAASDAGGLNAWIAANTASPLADAAREQLALSHSDAAPADAMAMALQISTAPSAADLGRRILDDWRTRDLAAASLWAADNPREAQFLELQR